VSDGLTRLFQVVTRSRVPVQLLFFFILFATSGIKHRTHSLRKTFDHTPAHGGEEKKFDHARIFSFPFFWLSKRKKTPRGWKKKGGEGENKFL
jgi:hypothetical protein